MSVVDVFGAGIPLSTNFALQSNLPVDARLVVANEDSLAQFNKNNLYVGAIVYVVETDQHYKFNTDFTFTPFKTGGGCNMIIFASGIADTYLVPISVFISVIVTESGRTTHVFSI